MLETQNEHNGKITQTNSAFLKEKQSVFVVSGLQTRMGWGPVQHSLPLALCMLE